VVHPKLALVDVALNKVLIHGVISTVLKMVLSLYNMDKDLLKFLIARFTCDKLKELRFVTKAQARHQCKEHKIQDPYKSTFP